MLIASFTVTDKKGVSWCADNLTISVENHPTEHGQRSVLNFICSGGMVSIPAEEVVKVEFWPTGAQHCNHCDQSIYNVLGVGIAANEAGLIGGG